MTRSRGLAWLFAFLLICCGGMTWLILQQLQAKPAPMAKIGASGGAVELPPLSEPRDFALASLDTMEEVFERPLFSQSRRPPSVEAASVVESPRTELKVTLRGIVFADGAGTALLQPQSGGDLIRLRGGQRYQGWTLSKVEPQQVTFERDGETIALALDFDIRPQRAAKSREPNKLREVVNKRKQQLRELQKELRQQEQKSQEEPQAQEETQD